MAGTAQSRPPWTFLTNHAHVLLCLADAPEARLREVAARIGITERAVQRIVSELVQSGCLTRTRSGRRNRYQIHREKRLGLPVGRERSVGDLMAMALTDSSA
ncbi:MAG: AsnC family transcriptional regulator [Verrucomicrobia bacterium]|nr:MAG: AsnC family transcriptional regulator [Verrucomicrobiota bacterium]